MVSIKQRKNGITNALPLEILANPVHSPYTFFGLSSICSYSLHFLALYEGACSKCEKQSCPASLLRPFLISVKNQRFLKHERESRAERTKTVTDNEWPLSMNLMNVMRLLLNDNYVSPLERCRVQAQIVERDRCSCSRTLLLIEHP